MNKNKVHTCTCVCTDDQLVEKHQHDGRDGDEENLVIDPTDAVVEPHTVLRRAYGGDAWHTQWRRAVTRAGPGT